VTYFLLRHDCGFSSIKTFTKPTAVASVWWVTAGAATEGVTPLFFSWKNWRPFFTHRCHYHCRFLLFSFGYHLLQGVTPHLFYLSDLISPLFFLNLPTHFFLRVSPPGGCHPGRSAPLVTPLQKPTCKFYKAVYRNHSIDEEDVCSTL